MSETYLTKAGVKKMQEELKALQKQRHALLEEVNRAAQMGDLSENFDYQNAKEEQGFMERRIAELEDTLFNTKVVEGSSANEAVQIGSKVTLETGKEKWIITITGPQEADPLQNKISASSPLGEALLGKKVGDKCIVELPSSSVTYKILKIE